MADLLVGADDGAVLEIKRRSGPGWQAAAQDFID
jgi:hypothetical protein